MSDVSELLLPPASGGDADADAPPVGTASPRPVLPTLPPRASKVPDHAPVAPTEPSTPAPVPAVTPAAGRVDDRSDAEHAGPAPTDAASVERHPSVVAPLVGPSGVVTPSLPAPSLATAPPLAASIAPVAPPPPASLPGAGVVMPPPAAAVISPVDAAPAGPAPVQPAGGSIATASIAGPSIAGPSIAGPSIAGPSIAGPSIAGPSIAGPSSVSGQEAASETGHRQDIAVDRPMLPTLPTRSVAPVAPVAPASVAGLRLNLEPIEEVAARAAAGADHAAPATPAAFTARADVREGDATDDVVAGGEPPSTPAGPVIPKLAATAATAAARAKGGSVASPDAARGGAGDGDVIDGDVIDEAAIEASVEDALAAAAAKSGDPHLLAAAAHFAAQKQAKALPQVKGRGSKKQRSGRKRVVALALVLVVGGGSAYVLRDTTPMQRLRGVGYDPQALPGTVFERPAPGTVQGVREIASVQQSPTGLVSVRTADEFTVNPITGDGQHDGTRSVFPITDGRLGDVAAAVESTRLIRAETATYRTVSAGEGVAGDDAVWETTTADPLDRGVGNVVLMYQDVVDESLRLVRPVATETTTAKVPLTTTTWQIPLGEFYESAPQLSALVSILDDSAGPDATVTVVLSVDEAGVVHLLDVSLELADVLAHLGTAGATPAAGTSVPGREHAYRSRWELRSMSDEAFVATAPPGAPAAVPAVPAAGDPAAVDPAVDPAVVPPSGDPGAAVPAGPADPAAVPAPPPDTVPASVPASAPVAGG